MTEPRITQRQTKITYELGGGYVLTETGTKQEGSATEVTFMLKDGFGSRISFSEQTFTTVVNALRKIIGQ